VSTLRDLPMKAIGDGRYVFLSGTDVLLEPKKKGQPDRPIVIDFNMRILSGDMDNPDPIISNSADVLGVEPTGQGVGP
jgi:hypothetical protein